MIVSDPRYKIALCVKFSPTQIITVTPIPDDDDFIMAERDGNFGKIPSTYVELL